VRRGLTAAAGAVGAALAERSRDVWAILLLLGAVISGLGIYLDAAGPVGRWIDAGARGGFGLVGSLLPVVLALFGTLLLLDRGAGEVGRLGTGGGLLGSGVLAGTHLVVDVPAPADGLEVIAGGGGLVGWLLAAPLDAALSRAGAWAVVVALGVLGLVLVARIEPRTVVERFWGLLVAMAGSLRGALARPALRPQQATELDGTLPAGPAPDGTASDDVEDGPDLPAVEERAVVDVWLDDDPEDATTEILTVEDVHDALTERLEVVDATTGTGDDGDVGADEDDLDADEAAVVSPAGPQRERNVLPRGEERPY